MRLHDVSIHRNFYKVLFINKYAKILESSIHRVSEFFSEI